MKCICKICDSNFNGVQRKCNICFDCRNIFKSVYILKARIKYLLHHGVKKNTMPAHIYPMQLPFICNICNSYEWRNDSKTYICYECKNKPKESKKGKTYFEIYGTSNPSCGFKKGDANIAKTPHIREKISDGVRKSYTSELRKLRSHQRTELNKKGKFGIKKHLAKDGNTYRSSLEVAFADLLFDNNISYQYEPTIHLKNGHIKKPDFIVNNTIIEITGIAYPKWQNKFIEDITALRDTIDTQIIILTYPEKVQDLDECRKYDTFIGSIYDSEDILEKLHFCNHLHKWQHMEKQNESIKIY